MQPTPQSPTPQTPAPRTRAPRTRRRTPPPGGERDRTQASPPSPAARARSLLPLAAVAAAFTAAQLLLVVPGTGLGWDETVYVSQVDPRVPAAFFSAPRARGISWLAAPPSR
ncbi:hypothetical protein [Streptomyces sp. NPDC001380]|uniref:hypothetical protein n=1 Tax=Streptomyces sp. NPDC001380 TaxID=3364566 RepID=UPI003699F6CF